MQRNNWWVLLIWILFPFAASGQEEDLTDHIDPVQAELLAEKDADEELPVMDLLDYREQMKNRIAVNSASRESLTSIDLLTPMQVFELLKYREELGPLLSPYELQAVPGWGIELIRKVLPYLDFDPGEFPEPTFKESLRKGDHLVILRSGTKFPATRDSSFAGNGLRITAMYRYNYRNRLQYGFLLDKDAGEAYGGGKLLLGDFSSFYFTMNNPLPFVSQVFAGDFTINLGQGLIQWQGFGFSKGSEIAGIRKQGPVIRPYRSSGEFNFYRGLGISLARNNWKGGFFISSRKLDANLDEDTIRSWLLSGLHRTEGEIKDRNSAAMQAGGFRISKETINRHIAINGIGYRYSHYFQKRKLPYNRYSIAGKHWYNLSLDYSLTRRNLHFFGELAIDPQKDPALLQGLLVSLHRNLDMAILFRKISPGFQSMFSRAFTENTSVSNESGLYMAISMKSGHLKLDFFGDMYRFPWLKYRVDAPSGGMDYGLKFSWNPSRAIQYYTRIRREQKEMNDDNNGNTHRLETIKRFNIRSHLAYKVNREIEFRARMELNRVKRSGSAYRSFLGFGELHLKPAGLPLGGSARIQVFESGNFESRIYAFENDLPYSYSVPFFQGSGWRYYLNIHFRPGSFYKRPGASALKNLRIFQGCRISMKWAQTILSASSLPLTGNSLRNSSPGELKFQVMWDF